MVVLLRCYNFSPNVDILRDSKYKDEWHVNCTEVSVCDHYGRRSLLLYILIEKLAPTCIQFVSEVVPRVLQQFDTPAEE